jgi:hypothetical protein
MICPNFSNPQISKQFYDLAGVVGEDFAYFLWDKNDGLPLTLKVNPNNPAEVIPNPLYESLDEKFGGDFVKATLGTALTYGSTFKKANPKFNSFTPQQQADAISGYVNNLDISLEDATQNYIKKANTINRTFKRAYKNQEQVVAREDLRKDPNSVVNQVEDLTAEDRTAAYEFFKTNNLLNKISFKNAQGVVNSGAYAQWTKKGVTLYKGSDYTDLYHEAWHEFTQWFLTPQEKAILYGAVRAREGSVTLGDISVPYYALSQRQAEEVLAEEFRAFSIKKARNEKAENLEPKVKGFFERLYDWLQWLFYGAPKTNTPVETFNLQNVNSLFEAFYNGDISTTRKAADNIIEDSLNRSTAFSVPIVTDEGVKQRDIDPATGAEIISYVSYSIYKQMRDQKIGMSSLLNPETRAKIIPELYIAVRAEINDIIDKLEVDYEKAIAAGKEATASMIDEQMVNLIDLVNEDEAWQRVVDMHQISSQAQIFLVEEIDDTKDEKQDQQADNEPIEENTRNTVEYGDKSNVNPLDLYDPYVVELIKGMPDIIRSGDREIPSTGRNLGLPLNGDFQRNKNLLQNLLSGVTNYQQAIDTLVLASEQHPQLKYLIQLLPDPNAETLSLEETSLQAQFVQALSMPRIDPYSIKARETTELTNDGEVKNITFNTFYISTLTQDALLEYLDDEFQKSAVSDFKSEADQATSRQRQFVNKSISGLEFATFSTASLLDEYKITPESSDSLLFEFMDSAFGVDLYQGIDPQYLFDAKGNIKLSNSRYTKAERNALNKVSIATYNKVKLYHLINNLPKGIGKSMKDLIPARIETPAKTFIEDVKASLVKEIEGLNKVIEKTTKEEHKQALQEILDLYNSLIKGNNNLRNERQILFRSIENHYNKVVKSASYLNDENNLEWSIREWQHVVTQAAGLNQATSLADLTGHLSTSDFVANSRLINRAFDTETGSRISNRDGDNVLFELVNISGYSTKPEGKKTINLDPDDKLIQDLTAFIKDGIVENLRYGAKSTSLGLRTNGSRADRLFFDRSKFAYNEETGRIILDPQVITTFKNYLRYELSRMYDDRAESTAKEKRGFDLIILKDILGDRVESLKAMIKNSTEGKEATVESVLKTISGAEMNVRITDYFNNEINAFKQDLAEALNQGNVEAKGKKGKSLAEVFKEIYKQEQPLEVVLADYVTHYYTQQIEFLHLFVGDPSNFQIKGGNWRELFKRLGASISPGKQPIISQQLLRSWNNSTNGVLGRGLEKLYKQPKKQEPREYDGTFNYVQFKDVPSFTQDQHDIYREDLVNNYAEWLRSTDTKKLPIEAYRAKAEELFQKTIDGAEGQSKEADGQAYANLDFVRFYLNSIGEWFPKQEKAYQHELKVAAKIQEYRKNPTQELRSEVEDLIANANVGILVSLKLGYWGSPTNDPKYITLGKYSVAPLIPSALFDKDLESLMSDMLEKGVDFATFDSGNKMSLPVESIDFYTQEGQGAEERQVINKIPEANIVNFPMQGLRRQQYIAPKFKNEATLSTQLVKLIFSNFYVDGKFSSQYAVVPGLEDKINNLQAAFINNLQVIVETEKAKIYSAIGATLEGDAVTSIDVQKFADWVHKEFDKKDVPQSVYNYLQVENNRFKFSLDVAPQRALFESILSSALSKRVIRPKMFGEALIQVSSLGYNNLNTRYTKPSKSQVAKYGNSGLRDYGRIVNGKHQPAEVKVGFNPKKHAPLLKLQYKGEEILTVNRLNQALLDDEWVQQNSDRLTIVGVRIPVQGLNSMEHFRVKEFLPEVVGPVMIVPPSLVTKSGSDFDIDKLFMFEPQLDDDANLIRRKSTFIDNPKAVYDFVKLKKQTISELSELNSLLENKRQQFILTNTAESSESKTYEGLIASNGAIIRPLKNSKKELNEQKEGELFEKIALQATSLETFLETQKGDPEITALLKKIKSAKNLLLQLKDYSPASIKAGASNDLISNISEVLSEPAVMPAFLTPNDSPILRGLAEEYRDKYRSKEDKITSTSIFSPRTSIKIFRENATGKKALGIDAKTNALHKLFQQVGLKYTASLSNLYFLKSNKDNEGNIILGGLYDANGEHLISDIINEFINGHVDIEKEEWINYFNADKNRTSVILQMVLSGTPIRDAVLIANQPIVQHFLKNSKISQTSELLSAKRANVMSYLEAGLRKLNLNKFIVRNELGIPQIGPTIANMLQDDLFAKHLNNLSEANYRPSVENSRAAYNDMLDSNSSDIAAQLVFLSQYYVASEMNQNLLDLTSIVDFNTASYRNINDFYQLDNLKEVAENFNQEAVDKILNNSVLSPFNISNQAISISEQIFDVMASREYQAILNNFIEDNGKFWTGDQRVSEVNNLNNAVVHALIQKYSELDGQDFYSKYGPKSTFLTKGATGNLFSEYIALFTKGSQIADANLKNFMRKNLFLRNFRKKDVEGTKKFYIATLTNEKDVVYTNAMQQAFSDGLNYDKSTPEINARVRKFFDDVANATIVGQGFSIKFRSIHPYLPVEALESAARASFELRRVKDLLFSKEAKAQRKEGNEELRESMIKLLEFIQSVQKIYARNAYSPRKKSLNTWKFFPDYVNLAVDKGIRISSSLKNGLGLALSLASEKHPVTFRGKEFKTAEEVFKSFAGVFTIAEDNNAQLGQVTLLRQILGERFKQNLSLFAEVYKKGGSEFLRKSTYFQGAEFLRSTPTSMGGYIEAISNAYDDVYDEMFAAMLEAEEQGQTLTTEETSADETTTLKEDRSPFSEGDGVDFDNLGEFTAKGVNLNSTKPKAKSTGPKPPKSIEGEEVSPTPPNLNTEEVPAVEIPVGQQRVLITYPEVTTENLQRLYPELSEKQINVVANNLRQVFKGKFPDVDFESKC